MIAIGRPMRRSIVLFAAWTFMCWCIFRIPDDMPLGQVSLHSRELLARLENFTVSPQVGSTTETTEVNVFEAEPYIDKSRKLNETEKAVKLQAQIPNLPLVYWFENKNMKRSKNSSCAKYPSVYDIHFNNIYWQQTDTSNGTFFLYGAYLDVRAKNRLGPTVRILSMINRIEPTVKTFCQLWFNKTQEPIFSKVLEYKYIWYKKWGNYKQGIFQPYLLACQLPKSHWGEVPSSVSIVEKECDNATNNLRVIYNKPEDGAAKEKFAVCVKGLDFPDDDLSVRLVEWLEMLHTLGANKIFLYNLEVHPNVTKVLEHYVEKGVVDLTPLSLPGYQPNLPGLQHLYLKSKLNNKRQNELIPYNDCLYRNMYRYEYVALLDIDEVIMPVEHNNWEDMMEEVVKASLKVKNESRASYNFRNVYFMDEMTEKNEAHGHFKDIPPYLHMLQHVYRSANYTKPGQYVKCFHNPEKALILHNHFPLGCLGGVCTSYPVDTKLGHLQHYRSDCVTALKKSCTEFKKTSVKDTTIWRWKDQLIAKTTSSLLKMGFFGGKSDKDYAESGEGAKVP